MFQRETVFRENYPSPSHIYSGSGISSDSDSGRSEITQDRSSVGTADKGHDLEIESINYNGSIDSEELADDSTEKSDKCYKGENDKEDEGYSEELSRLDGYAPHAVRSCSAKVDPVVRNNYTESAAINRTGKPSINHGETGLPSVQWDFLEHITISRDQTKASNFKKEQLVALYDPKIQERTLQENINQQNRPEAFDHRIEFDDSSGSDNFDFDDLSEEGDTGGSGSLLAVPSRTGNASTTVLTTRTLVIPNSSHLPPQHTPSLRPAPKTSPPAPYSSIPGLTPRFPDSAMLPTSPSPRSRADPFPLLGTAGALSPENSNTTDVLENLSHGVIKEEPRAIGSKRKYQNISNEASIGYMDVSTEPMKAPRLEGGSSLESKTVPELEIEDPNFTHLSDSAQTISRARYRNESSSEPTLIDRLQKQINDLENEVKKRQKMVRKRPRVQVFHVVQDASNTTCLHEPTWTFGSSDMLGLKAEDPIINPEQYLQRNDDIIIAIYKTYSVPQKNRTDIAKHLGSDTIPNPKPSYESMRLVSAELREAVQQFLRVCGVFEKEFPSLSLHDHIPAPYLFWYRSRTNSKALSSLGPTHQLLFKFLTHWIELNYQTTYENFEDKLSRGRISQRYMDFLFAPGDVVVSKGRDQCKAYLTSEAQPIRKVESELRERSHTEDPFEFSHAEARGGKKSPRLPWRWSISCWSIGYDGDFYKTANSITLELDTETHNEEVDIKSLNIIPLRLADEGTERQLLQRGHTFWSCRVKRFVAYQGSDEDTLDNDDGRYMIDFASYKALHLDKQGSKKAATSQDNETLLMCNMSSEMPPPAPEIYLFPSTITGFSLRRKRWSDLDVDRITNVSWNKDAFNHLVVDDKTKELVQAVVANRIAREKNTDLIQGKGNGLIMLLHGGPGTGKTFTAESVAEMAEKPLYPVTCGDIGTKPEKVEKYLESVLHMGKIWDCVVLLDEADVFLEERSMADLTRNALVSVFLRALEYYDGILILTSNRVGTFDEAFKSRIQLALHYPNLTKSQRCRIWKNFLNRLRALDEPDIDFDDIDCSTTELAAEELNGRQIRNAITTGRQLARFQGKALSYQHLSHVIKVSGQFETYVKSTKEGLTDEEVARAGGYR